MSRDAGVRPLFGPATVRDLQVAVHRDYTSPAVSEALGLAGEAALARGDLAGAERLTRNGSATETLLRMFVLGLPVSESEAGAALAPLPVDVARSEGLLLAAGPGLVQAGLDLRPYSEVGGPDWWIVSDLAADVRPGVLDTEHVLGVGAAATTLAQATVRAPVATALDIGTGCGIQALHLSRHAARVTATDLSGRALRMAATTAALNGLGFALKQGSLLEPVAGRRFDLVVCNPPFIVGPGFTAGDGGFTYRDSGMAGDDVCRRLISGLPDVLTDGGTAQLLANWTITADEDWTDRVGGWIDGRGCDAWVWQREVADPAEYVALWLRDAGERPGTGRWSERYNAWLDWFTASGVLAVGMGLVTLRRTGERPRVVCEDVPQAIEQPAGRQVAEWFERLDWRRRSDRQAVLTTRLRACPGLVYETRALLEDGSEWRTAYSQLRQSSGLRWEAETDAAVATLVAACDGGTPLGTVLEVMASLLGTSADELGEALLPVVDDLVQRGFLVPAFKA